MEQDEIDNLIEQTDIVSLVSKYVKLEKRGKNYLGLCPFHNEKTPSFSVSPDKKMYNCFGCHEVGGPIKFIQTIENVNFNEAVKILCDFNGIKYTGAKIKTDPNVKYYKITDKAKLFYNKFLLNDKSADQALTYLKNRGITDDIIEAFEIGLSPNSYDTLYNVLADMGVLELEMEDVGLVDKSDNGKYHDLFVNRIMFPIKDERNNTLGFSARIFVNDPKQPKYINSRDTKIFRKGTALFNINNAKPEIIKKDRIVIHEGQMDVIAAYKAGIKEVVCSLGTAIGDEQAKKIARLTKNVIICFDGDKAGIESSKKAIKLFKKYNFNVRLVLLPNKMDPDEYVLKFGAEAYNEYFEKNIIDDIEYLYRVALIGNDLSDHNILNKVKKDVFSIISSIDSAILIEKYLKRFSEDIFTTYDSVQNDYEKFKNVKNHTVEVKQIKSVNIHNVECELRIIYYATKSKRMALDIEKEISNDLDAFSEASISLWVALVNSYYEQYDEFDEQKFVNRLSEDALKQYMLLNEVLGKSKNKDFNQDDLDECILKIKDIKLKLINKNLENKVLSSNDPTVQSRLIDEMFKNKRKRENRKEN